jgi:peptidoglycan hydrolase-like protein with peptidoglycan-binding domain
MKKFLLLGFLLAAFLVPQLGSAQSVVTISDLSSGVGLNTLSGSTLRANQITISGTGFTTNNNTISVQRVGSTIVRTFKVKKNRLAESVKFNLPIRLCNTSSNCESLELGATYQVKVSNANGESNAKTFVLNDTIFVGNTVRSVVANRRGSYKVDLLYKNSAGQTVATTFNYVTSLNWTYQANANTNLRVAITGSNIPEGVKIPVSLYLTKDLLTYQSHNIKFFRSLELENGRQTIDFTGRDARALVGTYSPVPIILSGGELISEEGEVVTDPDNLVVPTDEPAVVPPTTTTPTPVIDTPVIDTSVTVPEGCLDLKYNQYFSANFGYSSNATTRNETTKLQNYFIKKGYMTAGQRSLESGKFGRSTAIAAIAFQKRNGISPTVSTLYGGIVNFGPASRAKLKKLTCNTPVLPPTIPDLGTPPYQSQTITVVSPNGGENLVRGQNTIIKWEGGSYPVQVGIVKDTYIAGDAIVGWINLNANAEGSLTWDTNRIGPLDYLTSGDFWTIPDGEYKVIVVSKNSEGNYCTSSTDSVCNVDVSDNSFTISSSIGVSYYHPLSQIYVLAPKAGEKYFVGTPLSVKWTNPNVEFDSYLVSLGNGVTGNVESFSTQSKLIKEASLVISNDVFTKVLGNYTATQAQDNFYIHIQAVKNDAAGGRTVGIGYGEKITLLPALVVTTPSITVTTANVPNAVETWYKSSPSRTITWTSTNIAATEQVNIVAYSTTNPSLFYSLGYTQTLRNTGTATVDISNLPVGTYKIEVFAGSFVRISDRSDGTVKVEQNAPTTPSSEYINITAPWSGGEKLIMGKQYTVTWTRAAAFTGTANVYLVGTINGVAVNRHAGSSNGNSLSFDPMNVVSATPGTYTLMVCGTYCPAAGGFGDSVQVDVVSLDTTIPATSVPTVTISTPTVTPGGSLVYTLGNLNGNLVYTAGIQSPSGAITTCIYGTFGYQIASSQSCTVPSGAVYGAYTLNIYANTAPSTAIVRSPFTVGTVTTSTLAPEISIIKEGYVSGKNLSPLNAIYLTPIGGTAKLNLEWFDSQSTSFKFYMPTASAEVPAGNYNLYAVTPTGTSNGYFVTVATPPMTATPTITVTSPGTTSWSKDTTSQTITWTSSGVDPSAQVNVVAYSTTGSQFYNVSFNQTLRNTGSATVNITNLPAGTYQIEVDAQIGFTHYKGRSGTVTVTATLTPSPTVIETPPVSTTVVSVFNYDGSRSSFTDCDNKASTCRFIDRLYATDSGSNADESYIQFQWSMNAGATRPVVIQFSTDGTTFKNLTGNLSSPAITYYETGESNVAAGTTIRTGTMQIGKEVIKSTFGLGTYKIRARVLLGDGTYRYSDPTRSPYIKIETQTAQALRLLTEKAIALNTQLGLVRGASTIASSCVVISSDLQVGSTGGEVTALQTFLKNRGYDASVTSYFGLQTFHAIKQFQANNGINATGFAGPSTREAIANQSCN